MQNSVVIVGIARTPQGNLLGALKDIPGHALGSLAIKAALERANIPNVAITEVLMGCVLPAAQGQAPARQAALNAGLPEHVGCTTLNKVCGSGMKAVMLAHDILLASQPEGIIVAGGMESMSNAPYLLTKARAGYRLGHGELLDHMQLDGLEDAYQKGRSMGYFADQFAQAEGFSRAEQDAYAMRSLERAQAAIRQHLFENEITPVSVRTKAETLLIKEDEHPFSVKIEKIPQLPAAFVKEGTVTAANSSSIADGAAALVLMRADEAKKRGFTPLARIVSHSAFAKKPEEFTTAPIDAIRHLMKKIGWSISEVDLFEINEAFAVVTLAAMRALNIPAEKLNIHGGGCALGHPIGATGARIIVTLLSALQQYGLKRGIASLCIGGGEATAVAIELV